MIVPVTKENIRDAAAIHSKAWQESHKSFCSPKFVASHTPDRQQAYLEKEQTAGKQLFMLVHNRPVGIVSVQGSLIENLYVLPRAQNKGFGSELLEYAIAQCGGIPTLRVLNNNEGAYRLYARRGFRPTGKKTVLSETLSEVEMALERNVTLGERTAETATIYFERARDPDIKRFLPQKAQTLEEALEDYRRALLPGAKSYGRTIYLDGQYIGDVWCYGMNKADAPNAMVSYCVFEKSCWSKGAATAALHLFLVELRQKFSFQSVGAFTFSENLGSIRVLEKNGFRVLERFTEDGVGSVYLQWDRKI